MRTGRLPAQRLGLGTIVNRNLTAGRRIMYFNRKTSGTNDNGNLTLADSTTYMSTIEAAFACAYQGGLSNATGSIGRFIISSITYGTVAFVSEDTSLIHKAVLNVLVIGTPDASYIVD